MNTHKTLNKQISAYMPVITLILLVGVWYIVAIAVGKEVILPMPHAVIVSTFELFADGGFYLALSSSLLKILISFVIALVFGVALAVLSANFIVFERLLYPLIIVQRATPTMSVIFLCLLWFGKNISPVIVALLVIFPVLYSSVLTAIKSCDKRLIEMSALYKVRKATMVKKLYLPYVADTVYSDCVSVLSLTVKLIIAAEALSMSNLTLGRLMQISNDNLETARLFAVTVVAVLLSVLLEFMLKGIRYLLRRKRYGKNS